MRRMQLREVLASRPSWTVWTRPSCSAGRWRSCAPRAATATSPPPPTPSRCSRRRSCWPGCGTGPSPRPYDFQDAAVTCIEKDSVPGRRDVRRLVEIMMGGDRIGRVGYDALPPLARDVHDRLAPLDLRLEQRGVRRALLNIAAQPELARVLRRAVDAALPDAAGRRRPIMGERRLGEQADPGVVGPGARHPPAGADRARLRGRQHRAGAGAAAAPRGVRAAGDHGDRPGGGRGRDPVPAQPPPRRRTGQPRPGGAVGRAQRRRRARGAAPGPAAAGVLPHQRAGAAAVDRVLRQGRLRALLHAAADGLHRRRRHRPPGGGDARLPVQHGEPGAVAGLRPDPAGAGGRPVAPGGPGEDGAAVGGPDTARAACPAPSCGRGATNCSATPWWCPPTRATSAASSTPWSPSRPWPTSSWRRCPTRSGGCRTRCCCPGCRPLSPPCVRAAPNWRHC